MVYIDKNVFEEGLERINLIFDTHEDIVVSMSGGKDSTVLFEMALRIAREKNRLPLKVFWVDQEVEWQHTVDYMNRIMRMPEVDPFWYQVPFCFPNNLSQENGTIHVWDDAVENKWIHPLSDIAIHDCPIDLSKGNRDKDFYTLSKHLPEYISDKKCAVLVGMRMSESPRRRMSIVNTAAKWNGITWCTKEIGNTRKFWPIYDFSNDDIWTAIGRNHWEYNGIYDLMYRWGVPKNMMRVSALTHETAWHALELLQEFEPKTYNRFVERIPGASTFNHAFDEDGIIPAKLPFMFASWKEYRDYLFDHIIPSADKEIYIQRWKQQNDEGWYKTHVKELILNDTCGTINENYGYQVNSKKRLGGKYHEAHQKQFDEYMERKGALNDN